MDAENNRTQTLWIFWYIVLVDIAAGFFLSLSPLSFFGPGPVERSLELWLTVIVRAFEFSVMIYWLGRPVRDVLSEFGLRKGLWARGFATGVAAALILGGGFLLSNAILARWAGWSPAEYLGLAGKQAQEAAAIYRFSYIAVACVAGPFFEDVFFVGLLFSALRSRFRLPTAFVLALACFTAAHVLLNPQPQIIIWAAGGALFLGLYARYRTLLPGMIIHGIGNAAIFCFF